MQHLAALPRRPAVLEADLATSVAVADWILALQEARQRRTSVALVAAGEPRGAGLRFAVADLLVAGAVVDALEARGIDAFSPEVAAADAAYRALRPALGHLMSASVGAGDVPEAARRVDPARTAADVRVRRDHPDRP